MSIYKPQNNKSFNNEELGTKSIFFDPELNPLGKAPSGSKNYSYPLKYPINNNETLDIPLPKEPMPKFWKFYNKDLDNKVIEKEEIIKKKRTIPVPVALLKNKKTKIYKVNNEQSKKVT